MPDIIFTTDSFIFFYLNWHSPSGKQFMSCKEVSSYILSLNGLQDVGQPIAGQHDDRASRTDKLTLGSVRPTYNASFFN